MGGKHLGTAREADSCDLLCLRLIYSEIYMYSPETLGVRWTYQGSPP